MDINRLTKTRDDLCGIQQYYSQSVGPGKYTTTYLVPDARTVNPLAAEQLLMFPREGYGLNNAKVDADSMLRNESSFKSKPPNRASSRVIILLFQKDGSARRRAVSPFSPIPEATAGDRFQETRRGAAPCAAPQFSGVRPRKGDDEQRAVALANDAPTYSVARMFASRK